MLNGCLIKNRVLNLSYSKTVQGRERKKEKKNQATPTVMHDTTFSDHTSVSMWTFMTSVWHGKLVVWHMNKLSYICSITL